MKRPIYPVQDVTPSGRRRVAVDGKGNPAKDVEHATGWVMLPEDRPVHRKKRR